MHEENLSKYLGINVAVNAERRRVTLTLKKYIDKLMTRFDIEAPKRPIRVPLSCNPNIEEASLLSGTAPVTPRDYQSYVGSLMFAASTIRPDIQYAWSQLSQGNKDPTGLHYDQVRRAMRYLFDTNQLSLTYRQEENDKLEGDYFCRLTREEGQTEQKNYTPSH